MSIDIDGNDYHILDNLICQPRVICVEYNPTIPFWIDCYQEEEHYQFGASLKALNRLAIGKGYFLVSVTDTNLFFVKNEYEDLFKKSVPKEPIFFFRNLLWTNYAEAKFVSLRNKTLICSSKFI